MSSEFSEILLPRIRLFVRLCVNVSYFRLLLQNHLTNINQTWLKAASDKGDSSLLRYRAENTQRDTVDSLKLRGGSIFVLFVGSPPPRCRDTMGFFI